MPGLLISLRHILKKHIPIFLILISVLSSLILINSQAIIGNSLTEWELNKNPISAETKNTTEWLKNPSFDSPIDCWSPSFAGDTSDVNASIHSGQAHYEILGDKRTYNLIADPPLSVNWSERNNPYFPNRPDWYGITSDGCRVSHEFNDETAIQNPSI